MPIEDLYIIIPVPNCNSNIEEMWKKDELGKSLSCWTLHTILLYIVVCSHASWD